MNDATVTASEPAKKPAPPLTELKSAPREYTYEELQTMVDEMLAAA